jgi:leucyl aminopeptidase
MRSAHKTPDIALTARRPDELDADLLVFPVFESSSPAEDAAVDEACAGALSRARASGEFKGKLFDTFIAPITAPGWKTRRAMFVGAGRSADWTSDRLRRVATTAGLQARQRHITRIAFVPSLSAGLSAGASAKAEAAAKAGAAKISTPVAAQVVAEGVCVANFDGGAYKTNDDPWGWLEQVEISLPDGLKAQAAAERGRLLGEYTNHARSFSNEPGNTLTPRVFAERAEALASGTGLSVDVLDETRIAALNMGLLLGVARGSQEPPRLVVLRHDPPNALPGVVLAFVGKGITFDTGGISIKPAQDMDRMKDDMSGGAAAICALAAIGRLKAPVRCMAVVPMTENMPGGRAMKPGDILKSAEGKTVEVLNTDAEGRLVLGDALWYARQLGATHLVDLATLTGAMVVALGKTTTGLFGTPAAWIEQVQRASERAGDRSWPMPTFDDYKELFKSEIADFSNTGGRPAGSITAALFLKEFTGELPWVHMDIAGTAWAEDAKPYQPKGATGVGVRTLVELALDAETWSKLDLRR